MDEEDVAYIHNASLSVIKKNEIMPFTATWIDQEIIILSELIQRDKDIPYVITKICGI